MRTLRALVAASAFVTSFAVAAPKAGGPRLDSSFGKRGVAEYTTRVSLAPPVDVRISGYPPLSAAVLDPQGRILSLFSPGPVAAGWPGGMVTAVLPDGTSDIQFGGGGNVDLTAIGAFSRMVIDSRGRLLVAGYRVPTDGSAGRGTGIVIRLAPNGFLDPTFGAGGQVAVGTAPTFLDIAAATDGSDSCFVFLADQPIPNVASPTVIVPPPGVPDPSTFADLVVKLSADGTPDPSYVGVLPPKPEQSFNGPFVGRGPFTVDSHGRFIAAETRGPGAGGDTSLAVLRLNAVGLMDPAFGDGGTVAFDLGERSEYAAGVTVDPAGRVVLLVDKGPPAIVRLLDDGTRDPSWGPSRDGVMDLSADRWFSRAKCLAVEGSRYFVAGERDQRLKHGRAHEGAVVMRVDSAGGAATAEWVTPFPRFASVWSVHALAVRDGATVVAVHSAFHAPRGRPYFALARVLFD